MTLRDELPKRKRLIEYIYAIPERTPLELYNLIRSNNYIGQDNAVRALCLMAFRHIRRLKKIYINNIDPLLLPKKQNCLLIGATGCGKTFLVELLFRDLLKIPTVIIDITNYSETGYVGQDVSSILTRLFYAAEYDADLTSIGIVCIDEIDKISSGHNSLMFSGAGTTKDVTGYGVQRELLKILEATEIPVSSELSHSTYGNYYLIPTRDIAFIAAGAFSGFKNISQSDKSSTIGFQRNISSKELNKIAVDYNIEEVENTSNFQNYGLLPELVGRFGRIIPFSSLGKDELCTILEKNVISKYREDFRLDGIELDIKEDVLLLIAKKAIQKETGARGLDSILTRYLENAAFDIYSRKDVKRLSLKVENDKIKSSVD
jgi:ATP-dependent Clp protease ATP-binding subunit ClpX